jgi:hypothetical protein
MSLTKATNSMIRGAPVNVLDFGADPTGVADSLAAFNAALAAGNYVVVPIGTYKVTGTINIVAGKAFVGLGVSGEAGLDDRPKIVPTAAVTGCALEVEGTRNWIQGIFIDGAATSGIIGIRVGNVVLANLAYFVYVEANNFLGSGAKCLQVINNVGLNFQYCRFNNAQQCLDIGSLTTFSGAPTTVYFYTCQFREAVGVGVSISRGFQIVFEDCLFEANFQNGLLINNGVGQLVLGVRIIRGWFESNWRSLTPPAITAEYHLDINGSVGAVEDIVVDSTFFSLDATSERAIRYNTVFGGRIIAPQTGGASGTGQIAISNGSGFIDEYRSIATAIIGPYFSNQLSWANLTSEWTDWTPVYTPNGSMTFTSVTTTARYKIVGKSFTFELIVAGTTGGVANSFIGFTLPSGVIPRNSNFLVCYMDNNGTNTTGFVRFDGTNIAGLYKNDGSNFTLGTTQFKGSFTIEID